MYKSKGLEDQSSLPFLRKSPKEMEEETTRISSDLLKLITEQFLEENTIAVFASVLNYAMELYTVLEMHPQDRIAATDFWSQFLNNARNIASIDVDGAEIAAVDSGLFEIKKVAGNLGAVRSASALMNLYQETYKKLKPKLREFQLKLGQSIATIEVYVAFLYVTVEMFGRINERGTATTKTTARFLIAQANDEMKGAVNR